MPVHPAIASKFHLLDGLTDFEAALGDPELRGRLDEFQSIREATPPPGVDVRDTEVPGPHGPVPVRVYEPPAGAGPAGPARPGLVWMHGGAFRAGDLDMPEADWTARHVAARAGAVVVSVDYRLALGGVTYPVPHDDVVAAIRWTRDHAAELGVDPARVSVGGASAGGNLAAGAVLRLRDDEGWSPANLLLVYAVAHGVLPPATSELEALMAEVPVLLRFPPQARRGITENYLGGPASRADGYAMPAGADVTGLCPVLLLHSEYDDLRTSGEAFAAQLARAGVDVHQVVLPGMLHGFLNLPAEIEQVDRALTLLADAVGRCVPGADG